MGFRCHSSLHKYKVYLCRLHNNQIRRHHNQMDRALQAKATIKVQMLRLPQMVAINLTVENKVPKHNRLNKTHNRNSKEFL